METNLNWHFSGRVIPVLASDFKSLRMLFDCMDGGSLSPRETRLCSSSTCPRQIIVHIDALCKASVIIAFYFLCIFNTLFKEELKFCVNFVLAGRRVLKFVLFPSFSAILKRFVRYSLTTSTSFSFQTFDDVTILFGYVNDFTKICNKVEAMKVVQLVSEVFSLFDILSENHKVYKVCQ